MSGSASRWHATRRDFGPLLSAGLMYVQRTAHPLYCTTSGIAEARATLFHFAGDIIVAASFEGHEDLGN